MAQVSWKRPTVFHMFWRGEVLSPQPRGAALPSKCLVAKTWYKAWVELRLLLVTRSYPESTEDISSHLDSLPRHCLQGAEVNTPSNERADTPPDVRAIVAHSLGVTDTIAPSRM